MYQLYWSWNYTDGIAIINNNISNLLKSHHFKYGHQHLKNMPTNTVPWLPSFELMCPKVQAVFQDGFQNICMTETFFTFCIWGTLSNGNQTYQGLWTPIRIIPSMIDHHLRWPLQLLNCQDIFIVFCNTVSKSTGTKLFIKSLGDTLFKIMSCGDITGHFTVLLLYWSGPNISIHLTENSFPNTITYIYRQIGHLSLWCVP